MMDTKVNYSGAQRDLLLMVGHAVRTPPFISLPPEKLTEAITAASKDESKIDASDASKIFRGIDYFSRYLSPATLDGLRFACESKGTGIPVISNIEVFYMLMLLFTTVTLQCYALFGNAAIAKIDKNADTIIGMQREIQAMQAASPTLREVHDLTNKTNNQLLYFIDNSNHNISNNNQIITYLHKRESLKGAENNQCNTYQTIYQFNWPWGMAMAFVHLRNPRAYWGEELCVLDDVSTNKKNISSSGPNQIFNLKRAACDERNHAGCQIAYGSEFEARYIVKILDIIVLPVLYSMLGAWVWVIRDRYRRLNQRNLIKSDLQFPISRLSLAAALGSIVGFLNTSTAIGTAAASVPLAGLGFIVGYNVEIVFRWLDGFGTVVKMQRSSGNDDASVSPKPESS